MTEQGRGRQTRENQCGHLSVLSPSLSPTLTSLGTCHSWPVSQERRAVLSKEMSVSVLLVCVCGEGAHSSRLCCMVMWQMKPWLQIGVAVSDDAHEFTGDHWVGVRTRVLMIRTPRAVVCSFCRMAGSVQRTLHPSSHLNPTYSHPQCLAEKMALHGG